MFDSYPGRVQTSIIVVFIALWLLPSITVHQNEIHHDDRSVPVRKDNMVNKDTRPMFGLVLRMKTSTNIDKGVCIMSSKQREHSVFPLFGRLLLGTSLASTQD